MKTSFTRGNGKTPHMDLSDKEIHRVAHRTGSGIVGRA